jgi:hypothetical protein
LALAFNEPRYWESPDALNLFDLADPKALSSVDRLRHELQKHLPLNMLDAAGKERRDIDEGAELLRMRSENESTAEPFLVRLRSLFAIKSVLLWLAGYLFPWKWKRPERNNILDGLGPKGTLRNPRTENHQCTLTTE